METDSKEKYNSEEEIFKLCEKYKITFIAEKGKNDYEKIKSVGMLPLLHNEFLIFIEEKKNNGDYILDVKVPNTNEKYGCRINYLGGESIEEELTPQQTTIFRQLASDFYKKQPYFFDSSKVWWAWDKLKYCWEVKDEIDIMNKFDKHFVQESEKSNIKNGILEALKKCGRMKQPKEIKTSWVQFQNKIYDIKNNEIFEATPEFFVANPLPWKLGESEDTPNIDKLFSTWVSKEDIPKLYELIAFSCVPEMFIHAFHFLFSPPGMGKGTFIDLLLKFIGRKNAVSTSIHRINSNPRFETRNWHKKLLITMSEVSNVNDLKNSGLINQATGGDPIPAEVKGGGGFDFVNYGKIIYPTNKLLKIDPEDGFGRRARTIKFVTRFEREKDVLSEILDKEYNNLAKKCLRIAKELYKKRRFTGDVNISERMNNYQEESKTNLEKFIDNSCDTENFEDKVLLDEFFAKYLNNLKETGGRPITKPNLAKELKQLGWETHRELTSSLQTNFDGSVKKDLKSFILGLKISSISSITPNTHLDSKGGCNRDVGVIPVLPDINKEINDLSKKENPKISSISSKSEVNLINNEEMTDETKELYNKHGLKEKAEKILKEIKTGGIENEPRI